MAHFVIADSYRINVDNILYREVGEDGTMAVWLVGRDTPLYLDARLAKTLEQALEQ